MSSSTTVPAFPIAATTWHAARGRSRARRVIDILSIAGSDAEPSDEALMAAYVDGDAQAFRVLFERYSSRLLRLFRASRLDGDAARDLLQQTFLQLHRSRNDFRVGAQLRPWLFTIANNLKRDLLRSRGRWREDELDPEREAAPATQAADLQRRDVQGHVRAALARLPAEQREVVELHWFGELPFSEIARTLGIGTSAAKVRAHRAYGKLKEWLAASEVEIGR